MTDLAGLSVTVVGIYYAPDSTGIAPYTTDLCETLAGHGASVHAVVGVPHYPQWTIDPSYRSGLVHSEERNGVRVTRVRHFVPRSQDVARRALYELTFWLGSRLASRRDRPDVVLGVTPNLAGAATAAALARRTRAPLGIVVQDLVGRAAAQSGMPGGGRLSGRVSDLEAAVMRSAQVVGAIGDSFVEPLLAMGVAHDRIRPLPNYARLTVTDVDRDEARRLLGWPADRRVVLHTGNMGLKQDLGNVVAVARLAPGRRDDVRFVLLGDGSMRRGLQEQARGLTNLVFLDPVSDREYPVVLAAADCLLLNERPSVLDMSLPSKLTSYLAAGRPVVAATNPVGATATEVLRSQAGLVVPPGDPAALLGAVEKVLDDGRLSETLAEHGRRYAARELSQAAARARVIDFVGSVASSGGRSARHRPGPTGRPSPAGRRSPPC